MKNGLAFPLLLVAACSGLQRPSTQQSGAAEPQLSDGQHTGIVKDAAPGDENAPVSSAHVILIIEENHSFSTVYPKGMPWLSSLGNTYGIATNYFSNQSGSLLDYFWLSSGSSELQF